METANGRGETRKRDIYASNRVTTPLRLLLHCYSRHDDVVQPLVRVKRGERRWKKKGRGGDDPRGCVNVHIQNRGLAIFHEFLISSRGVLAARVAQGIENVDVSKEREWPVSRATEACWAPPPLWSLPSFQPFSSLSLFTFPTFVFLYPRSHTSLCRAISFGRFAPTKSRKLWEGMREGEGKFFARNPRSDSPLPGPRDQPATLMMLLHRRDFWGEREKEREKIYLLPHHLCFALIISGQTKKSIFSEWRECQISREEYISLSYQRDNRENSNNVGNEF